MDGDAVLEHETAPTPVPPAFTQEAAGTAGAPDRESRFVRPFFPGVPEDAAAPAPFEPAPAPEPTPAPAEPEPAPTVSLEPEAAEPSAAEAFIPQAESYFVPGQGESGSALEEAQARSLPAEPSEAVSDVADRLEKLAGRLRSQGPAALGAGLGRGDRFDVLLSGMLAGYLVNREEE